MGKTKEGIFVRFEKPANNYTSQLHIEETKSSLGKRCFSFKAPEGYVDVENHSIRVRVFNDGRIEASTKLYVNELKDE